MHLHCTSFMPTVKQLFSLGGSFYTQCERPPNCFVWAVLYCIILGNIYIVQKTRGTAVSLGRWPPKTYRGRTKVRVILSMRFGKVAIHPSSLTVRNTFQTGTKVGDSDPQQICGFCCDHRIKGTLGITDSSTPRVHIDESD